ncbi:MAG: D-alanyl-D-alanine carboxypeptidase [Bdellovibrionales bacterium]|jgi:D-alanyl-D-alanine carboxypeptidase|nr:D-alanyl-D-alanine carboxypeptidase [Bdellovibrionales bacterium]
MKGTKAAGRVRGKTGTLRGAYQLVGYIPAAGRYVPFVILTSTTVANRERVRSFQDAVVEKMIEALDREPVSASRK